MPSDSTITRDVIVEEEPEIQYVADESLFQKIEGWLGKIEARFRKETTDDAVYFDTKNNRLIREGIECRLKPKGQEWRVDLKVPLDTSQREAVPDGNGILWRSELKFRTGDGQPRLSDFRNQSLLGPVQGRVTRLFEKQLLPKFRMVFAKKKFVRTVGESEIEYSLQRGHIESMSGDKRTEELLIVELELREGKEQDLLVAKEEFEELFGSQELKLLSRRKVLTGFDLIRDDMDKKARRKFDTLAGRVDALPACDLAA